MKLIAMIDALLRDRAGLYRQAREETQLRTLILRLLMVFLLSSAIYGFVMGAFRCIHPAFFFSDFALTSAKGGPIQGDVAGMTPERATIYTRQKLPPLALPATVRFNLTDPSEEYSVSALGEEKGYNKIVLAPNTVLMESGRWLLPLLVAIKIPLLFLLTLLVCALALYILNLAVGLRLRFVPSMTLMLFALAGTGVILVVFAPVVMLFTFVTASYHFMKILHVAVFIIAGIFGVKILGEGLVSMQAPAEAETAEPTDRGKVKLVLFSWLVLYCLVGAQLAWTLKPYLGTPYLPATPPFRLEQGNIFVSTIESFQGIKGER